MAHGPVQYQIYEYCSLVCDLMRRRGLNIRGPFKRSDQKIVGWVDNVVITLANPKACSRPFVSEDLAKDAFYTANDISQYVKYIKSAGLPE